VTKSPPLLLFLAIFSLYCIETVKLHILLRFQTFVCRERSKKSLLTWEEVKECADGTGIVDKLEVMSSFYF